MSRLIVAYVLRIVVALSLGLAIVMSLFTVVGLALAVLGKTELSGGYGVASLALMWIVALAAALSVGRLAHVALGHVVDLGPPRA